MRNAELRKTWWVRSPELLNSSGWGMTFVAFTLPMNRTTCSFERLSLAPALSRWEREIADRWFVMVNGQGRSGINSRFWTEPRKFSRLLRKRRLRQERGSGRRGRAVWAERAWADSRATAFR